MLLPTVSTIGVGTDVATIVRIAAATATNANAYGIAAVIATLVKTHKTIATVAFITGTVTNGNATRCIASLMEPTQQIQMSGTALP